MTMQIQATGLVGTKKAQANIEGIPHNVYRVRHLGLAGKHIWLNAHVVADSPIDQRLETLRSAAEKGSQADNPQFIRVLVRGGDATLNVRTDVHPDGKVDRASNTLQEGAVCKPSGIDFLLTNVRQITTDLKQEPEECSVTILGQMTRGRYKDRVDKELKSIDLLMAPHQAGQDEGFHLRVIGENGTPAKEVLSHPDSPDGFYWVSGSLVRDYNEEGNTEQLIPPWDRIAVQATTVYLVDEQVEWKQKQANQKIALTANQSLGPGPLQYVASDESAVSTGISFVGGLDDD